MILTKTITKNNLPMNIPTTLSVFPYRLVYKLHFYSSTTTMMKNDPSFFTYNSGRARRKRKLRFLLYEKKQKLNNVTEDDTASNTKTSTTEDTRTIMDILFPNPFKDVLPPHQPPWPTTYTKWKQILSLTWRDYKATWVGFTTSQGIMVQDEDHNTPTATTSTSTTSTPAQVEQMIHTKRDEVARNMKRNRRFLQFSATKLRDEVRTRTGINSIEDIKQYAADAMRLATECVQQFMQGYRKGRDDEVENMLKQYFQQLEQTAIQNAEKKPRRKMKRRVVNRFHPMYR
jgi:hypothetical protein